jgi:hypothetical protein
MPRARPVKKRFAIYADFLGTKERYARPKLVVRGRELLEQALARCVLPRLGADDMHLYVFSDTAIITCPTLHPLLQPTADLFWHFLKLRTDVDDPMTLWLRAGVSHGSVLSVDHLHNTDRVRTIPFLDSSLPSAYRLESVRKGSRVFVDPSLPPDAVRTLEPYFVRWKNITGNGVHVPNVGEFLWPGMSGDGHDRLLETTSSLHRRWSDALAKKEWPRDEYYKRLIHLDETLKLFVRTASVFTAEAERKKLLVGLLPRSRTRQNNLRYKWGLWFQALRGIVEHCETEGVDRDEFVEDFQTVRDVLGRGQYLEHFLSELKLPDYEAFRAGLERLGLLPE